MTKTASYQDWMTLRLTWVESLTQKDLQRVMQYVENASPGELTNTVVEIARENRYSMERLRAECLLWLATRGQEGNDWGIPAFWAYRVGLWPPPAQSRTLT